MTTRRSRSYGIPKQQLNLARSYNYAETNTPIPIVYGMQRITVTVIWEGYIVSTTRETDSWTWLVGSSWKTSYAHQFWHAICFGDVTLSAFYVNNAKYSADSSGKNLTIWNKVLYAFSNGTDKKYPGCPTDLIFQKIVDVDKETVDYLEAPYGVATWWAARASIVYKDGTTPTFNLLVKKSLNNLLPNNEIYSNDTVSIFLGNNPVNVIYDLLTNNLYGIGIFMPNIQSIVKVGTLIILVGLNGCFLHVNDSALNTCNRITDISYQDFIKIIYGNGIYTAITDKSIFKSTDGTNWTNVLTLQAQITQHWTNLHYVDNTFFVQGRNVNGTDDTTFVNSMSFYYTNDNWATIYNWTSYPDTNGIGYIYSWYVNGYIVCLSHNGYTIHSPQVVSTVTTMFTSTQTWLDEQCIAPVLDSYIVRYAAGCTNGNTLLVIIRYIVNNNPSGFDVTNALKTTDGGVTWTRSGVNSILAAFNCYDIICINNMYIAVGSSGNIATSSDGIIWSKQITNTTLDLHSIIYDTTDNLYIASGNCGILLISSDGITWSKDTISIHDQLGIDIDSFETAGKVFVSSEAVTNGRLYGINCTLDSTKSASSHIKAIEEAVDCTLTTNLKTGLLTIIAANPFDDTIPDTTLYDEDIKGLQINLQNIKDLKNIFSGSFIDPGMQYKESSLKIKNEALLREVGIENNETVDLSYFINSDIAAYRLFEQMKKGTIPAYSFSGSISMKYLDLYPGKLIVLNSTEYSVNKIFRITKLTIGKYGTSDIDIEAEQAMERYIDTSYSTIMSAYGYSTTYKIPANAEVLPITNGEESGVTIGQSGRRANGDNLSVINAVVMWENGLGYSGLLTYGTDYYLTGGNHSKISSDKDHKDDVDFNGIRFTSLWENIVGPAYNAGCTVDGNDADGYNILTAISDTETLTVRIWNNTQA